MDYATTAINQGYAAQGSVLGGLSKGAEVPRTISSAASSIDALNERLGKANESLAMISAQIGAAQLVTSGAKSPGNIPVPGGAVYRLNNSADEAHATICDIENLVSGIGRALG